MQNGGAVRNLILRTRTGVRYRRAAAALALVALVLSYPAVAEGGNAATLQVAITPSAPIAVDVVTPHVASVANDAEACVSILVRTSIHGWSLDASYTTSPSVRLDLVLQPTAASCGMPASTAAPVLTLHGSGTTTLLSGHDGSETLVFAVVAGSRVPLTSSVTVTLALTANAPGAPPAQAVFTFALDRFGRLTAARP